jgi:hypothetical protein
MRRGGLWKSIFCLFLLVPMLWGTTALGQALIQVPGDYPNIQAAIDAATPGDTVRVDDGTYSGNLLVQKAITIESKNGADHTLIDCANTSRGFTFVGAEASGAVLSGFTITGGNGDGSGDWAGFDIWQGVGGAIACIQSSPIISHCNIENNSAMAGGGVSCSDSSSPTIIACIIGNSRADLGGGVYMDMNSSPLLYDCLITGNTATLAGGGLSCTSGCSPSLFYCTVSDNTVSENEYFGGGGIFSLGECSILMTNSILWGNLAANGPEIYLYSSSISIDYSDVRSGEGSGSIFIDPSGPSEVQWGEGNIDQDPVFASQGDYGLSPDSPCIDAGIELQPGELPNNDQNLDDFNYDIENHPRVSGNAPDMGAYELTPKQDDTLVVDIDIKPGCWDKRINLKSSGVLPVAVKTTRDFSARSIDPKTVVFAGAAPIGYVRHDTDRDRDKDMLFFFKIKKLNLDEDSTEATLRGKTKEGKPFKGTAKLSIEKPKRKAKDSHFSNRR